MASAANLVFLSSSKTHQGILHRCSHFSEMLGGLTATFSIFLPSCVHPHIPNLSNPDVPKLLSDLPESSRVPVIYYLAGLTSNDQTGVDKGGCFRKANELGVAMVFPDTSPRGITIPGDSENWDFGVAAGFYLNATEKPWDKHYKMYDYVVKELPELIYSLFPLSRERESIMGHSMGGHGALLIYLKNLKRFKSASAFAPICHPMECPWGIKAFSNYLGPNKESWKSYDTVELLKNHSSASSSSSSSPSSSGDPNLPTAYNHLNILIDQGTEDQFLRSPNQLLPGTLHDLCLERNIPITYRLQAGYPHNYSFVSTFMEDHIEFHHRHLITTTTTTKTATIKTN